MTRSSFALYLVWFLGFLGLADALFLTFNHFRLGGTPCTISGCETVTSSIFSTAFGLPISLIGVVYYLVILILAFLYTDTLQKRYLSGLSYLTLAASLVSLWLIYLQAFVIEAWCVYCLISALATFTIFIAVTFLLPKN